METDIFENEMKTIEDLNLKIKDLRAVKEGVRLLKERFPVQEVVLFGSKARGTDDEESDIDLLVLTTRELSWKERNAITDALFDVQMEHDVTISTLVVCGERWRHGEYSVLPIHDEIEEHGVAG